MPKVQKSWPSLWASRCCDFDIKISEDDGASEVPGDSDASFDVPIRYCEYSMDSALAKLSKSDELDSNVSDGNGRL